MTSFYLHNVENRYKDNYAFKDKSNKKAGLN